MKVMMDTHAFLWFIEGDVNLSQSARILIENMEYQKVLSIASLWEMSIKASLKRLELKADFPTIIKQYVYGNGFDLLSIKPEHLEQLARLPFYHKDPFDRLIIAQAITDNISIITKDSMFKNYPIRLFW